MKNLLNKGKVIVSCISVLAILAVSLLSMFTGVTFIASAEGEATEGETATYPLNGNYDADVVILEGGISYTDAATTGETSKFTGFDKTFLSTAEGKGTAANPYIIKTANQFAAVATGNLTDANGNAIDTANLCFKVADGVKAFDLSNTDSTVDFSGDMTAAEVEAALANANVITVDGTKLNWHPKAPFKGRFDGNAVTVYGLKVVGNSNASLFPQIAGIDLRNLTVKNCYFTGDRAAAIASYSTAVGGMFFRNIAIHNNVIIPTRLNSGRTYGGVVTAVGYTNAATNWEASVIEMYDSIVYDNIAKHSKTVTQHTKEYDIQYGLFGNPSHKEGAVVENCIVLDTPAYTLIDGHNAFHNSTYKNVYANVFDITIDNIDWESDGAKKINLTTVTTYNEDGTVLHKFDKATDGVSNKFNYERTHAAGSFFKIDKTAVTGAAAKDTLANFDLSKWTIDDNGLPMPKVYSAREYSAGDAWTGEVALGYSSGDGSKGSPFVINTAEELALMMLTAKSGQCFALGSDITINNDLSNNAKQWFTSNDVPAFEGTLDGKGYTVSGIYYDGTQAGEYAGLIPVLGSNAVVKNIKIADSALTAKNGAVGAVAGATADMCAQAIKTTAVVVEDTVKFDGNATKGGIIGKIGYSAVKIEDCISKSAGFYGDVTGMASIKRSISVGAYPFTSDKNVKVEGVYTDTEGLTVEGVTVVANADMIGAAAADSMPGLGFPTSWKVVDGDYPAATGVEPAANGVKGEAWTGAVATAYAGGDGSAENPYLIETAEQLARFVTKVEAGSKGNLKYYKLTADIYLNDVFANVKTGEINPLWADRVGCTEWYTQRTSGKGATDYRWFSLDGDGHVVYGMYLNEIGDDYYRAGLMPYLGTGAIVKNLGISQAYLKGNPEHTDDDNIGGIAGVVPTSVFSDAGYPNANTNPLYTHDAEAVRKIQWDPNFSVYVPKIENCFVDHTCYITAKKAGGFIGTVGGPVEIQNSIVTATVEAGESGGSFVGTDWSLFSTYSDCVSLPQNCVRFSEGSALADWRDSADVWTTQVYQVYYFAIKTLKNAYFIKLSNPLDRVGTRARNIMTGLDWDDSSTDGTQDLWRVVDGGTPVLTVFGKHRTNEELEKFSDKNFAPPEVTVVLETFTDAVELKPLVGRMYSKMSLPTNLEREGYEFTGWYAFSDCSVEYPVDYFPPRSLTLYAGWKAKGIIQGFENYTETIWDNDSNCWTLNKPGAKGGYKNAYVRNGSKSMHLLGTNTAPADCLLNYEEMLKPGTAYTITFWATTDKENNPATLLSLVHNSKPDYLNSAVAVENMAVATGLTAGKWVQYSYSFTAQTKWVSIRATAGSSLYFDDVMITELDGKLESGKVVNLGTGNGATGGVLSPNTKDTVSVAVLISAVMACAVIAVISRKNFVEIVEE